MALASAAPVRAQQWIPLDAPIVGGAAHDPVRGRAIAFGRDGRVLEFDGAAWLVRAASGPAPIGRWRHTMVQDPLRGRALLFGGQGATGHLGDTWTWDGAGWTQPGTTLTPPRRVDAAMAFDPVRGSVVLFGGADSPTGLQLVSRFDTWEHDGRHWHQRLPATVPTATSPELAFAPASGRMLLVGGAAGLRTAVWSWDGVDWRLESTANLPQARANASWCHDPVRQRTVLIGGTAGGNEIWEWDGAAWRLASTAMPARDYVASWFDPVRRQVLAHGGRDGVTAHYHSDLWAWDGSTLAQVHPDQSPPQRIGHTWIADPGGGAVLFGGRSLGASFDDTWSFDGSAWQRLQPPTVPATRLAVATAFDPLAGRGLVFGGIGPLGLIDELWGWDGTDWRLLSTGGPTPRREAAMAFDSRRGVALVFGGIMGSGTGSQAQNDLWQWDGTVWTPLQQPPLRPAPRSGSAMAYDPLRDRTVLFGGRSVPELSDTWEWDGSTWLQVAPPVSPALSLPSMAFDPVRQRLVLAGLRLRTSGPTPVVQLWEYDGQSWSLLDDSPWPLATEPRLVWHSLRQRMVLYDGKTLREWSPTPASVAAIGPGCGAVPQLTARTVPRIGTAAFGLELLAAPQAPVVFALSDRAGSTPVGGGCSLWVGPLLASMLVLADLQGLAVQPIPLPASLHLRGLEVFAQAAALLPGGGFGLSAGLRIAVGD